jgi:catechol 2,3-dioxygenase-like lactoylglutathione lyase family enzyme
MLRVEQLDHLTITARDPERSLRFYRELLGMVPCYEWGDELTMLRSGSTFLAVAHWARGQAPALQPPITVHHFAFRVDRATYERAPAELAAAGVAIEEESDHGVCRSLYFRDPDGHLVELACYQLTSDKLPRLLESR